MKRSTSGGAILPRRRPTEPPQPPPPPVQNWAQHLTWYLVLAGLILGLLYVTWSVVGTLFAAGVFAWLLHPLVSRLERRRLSRETATLIVLGGVLLVLLLSTLVVVPTVVGQIAELSANIRPYVAKLSSQVGPAAAAIEARTGVHVPLDLQELADHAPEYLQRISPDMRASVQEYAQSLATGGLNLVLGIFGALLLPLFVFYVLRDWPEIMAGTLGLLPVRWRPTVARLGTEIDVRLQAFVRGQLSVAFVLGCLYSVGLLIAGVDLALMVGFLGGLLFLVPYLGSVLAAVLAAILALLEFGFDWHVVAALATFGIGQGLEGTVVTPWLVGDRVGLHPLVVMLALIVGGNLLGMWGLVLAVPITATAAVLIGYVLERWRSSAAYGADP